MPDFKPFSETLGLIEFGQLEHDLSEQFPAMVQAVQKHQAKGVLTLKITVNPEGDGQYKVIADLDVKEPKKPRGKTLMFGTPDGNLQHSPYNQGELPIESPRVDTDTGEILDLPADGKVTPIGKKND